MKKVPPPKIAVLSSHGKIPPRGQAIVEALGRLMFNCGQFEFLSKSWIWQFEQNDERRDILCTKLWTARTKGLKNLIKEQSMDEKIKTRFIMAIDQASSLMRFRNCVAHGSLMVKDNDECVIYDSQITGEHPHGKKITVEEIEQKIDECADLFEQWAQCWKDKSEGCP